MGAYTWWTARRWAKRGREERAVFQRWRFHSGCAFHLAGCERHALDSRADGRGGVGGREILRGEWRGDERRSGGVEGCGAERRDWRSSRAGSSRDLVTPLTPLVINGVVFAVSSGEAPRQG